MMENIRHFTGRRHSLDVVALSNMSNQRRRISFVDQDDLPQKTQNRRHSVMFVPPQNRRMSIDPRSSRRASRRMSILPFSSFGSSTTFTGLPLAPQPQVKEENTYKMGPDEGTEFKAHLVRATAQKVLDEMVKDCPYMTRELKQKQGSSNRKHLRDKLSISSEGGKIATTIANEVKDQLKTLNMKRYKFVVNTFVGDCKGQGLMIASRSLWDTDTDGHITVQHKNDKHFIAVVVHAVYFE